MKPKGRSEQVGLLQIDGALRGDWITATAREVDDKVIDSKADHLLNKKYDQIKRCWSGY